MSGAVGTSDLPPRRIPFHLLAPREPRLGTCTHGRPDHQAMIGQLAEAMRLDVGAANATPEQVWAGLLDEVERRFRHGGAT